MARTFLVTVSTYAVIQAEVEVLVEDHDDDDVKAFDAAEEMALERASYGPIEWDWQNAYVDTLADKNIEDVEEL